MIGCMDVLKSVADEFRKIQAEREGQLLLEVLRRLCDLTFGDLATLMASPLGKKLASVKLSEAFVAMPEKAPAPVSPAPVGQSAGAAPASPTKSKRKTRAKAGRKPKVKAKTRSKTTRSATKSAKKVPAKKASKTRASTAAPPRHPATAKVSARSEEGRVAYDQAILAVLRELGDWASSTALRARVGGSKDQLWFAGRRRAKEGKLVRMGERDKTRYRLSS